MSQTLDRSGRPIFFPPWLETDERGVIRAIPDNQLPALADRVAPDQLFPLIRRLINSTSHRRREARWADVNRQRLALARLCLDRAINESLCTPKI
jgi:hypothetical protein